MKKLKIRDLTLRDGQQSLFATRLPQSSIDALLPYYEEAGFYAMEVWGGAVPDSDFAGNIVVVGVLEGQMRFKIRLHDVVEADG